MHLLAVEEEMRSGLKAVKSVCQGCLTTIHHVDDVYFTEFLDTCLKMLLS